MKLLDKLIYFFLAFVFFILSALNLHSGTRLLGWGSNDYGQLGDSTTNYHSTPTFIGTDTNWIMVISGYGHSLALKSNGTVWSWGYNGFGELGDNSFTNRIYPVQVGSDSDWIGLSASGGFSMAMKSDSSLWIWGSNEHGKLGNGTYNNSNSPIQVINSYYDKWLDYGLSVNSSFGITNDSLLWGWGLNSGGNLDNGTSSGDRLTPTQIANDYNFKWIKIISGNDGYHALGIRSDGTLWAWGTNSYGQLGDGSTNNHFYPVMVGDSNQHWKEISGNFYSSLAIKSNGTLWAWGYNNHGELGDNTTTTRLSPVRIGSDSNWIKISCYGERSVGLKSDGTLWVWGYNNGILGDGTTTDRHYPYQIGSNYYWLQVSTGGVTWGAHTFGLCRYDPPILSIVDIDNTTGTRVTLHCNINKTWGFNATTRGICWDSLENPTINNSHTTHTGNFGISTFIDSIINIRNLQSGKIYHVRAYAINGAGIGYSNDTTFVIPSYQLIPLQQGWNMISTYIDPDTTDFWVLCQPISQHVVIGKNNGGQFYVPSMGINYIWNWDYNQAYQFYLSVADTLRIDGPKFLPDSTPIYLSPGWGMISYLRNSPMSIDTALSSISSSFLIVKNSSGQFYIPSMYINTIGNMLPGQGYQIYMLNNGVLYYPRNW